MISHKTTPKRAEGTGADQPRPRPIATHRSTPIPIARETVYKTLPVRSQPLPQDTLQLLRQLSELYTSALKEAVNIALNYKPVSHSQLRAHYHAFRQKYRELPSRYIELLLREAAQTVRKHRFFLKKILAKTPWIEAENPRIKRTSVRLDQKTLALTPEEAAITTHRGRIKVPLKPYARWLSYFNSQEWRFTGSAKMKITGDRVLLYASFEKQVLLYDRPNAITIDLNEDNATIGVFNQNKLQQLIHYKHNLTTISWRYHCKRRQIESKYGINRSKATPYLNPIYRRAIAKLRRRELRRKRDIIYKLASYIANLAAQAQANIYIGDPDKASIINDTHTNQARHRLTQWPVKTIIREIKRKALEQGYRAISINEAYTSTLCPLCGSQLTPLTTTEIPILAYKNGIATIQEKIPLRLLQCPHHGLIGDRDCIAAVNIYIKAVNQPPTIKPPLLPTHFKTPNQHEQPTPWNP